MGLSCPPGADLGIALSPAVLSLKMHFCILSLLAYFARRLFYAVSKPHFTMFKAPSVLFPIVHFAIYLYVNREKVGRLFLLLHLVKWTMNGELWVRIPTWF